MITWLAVNAGILGFTACGLYALRHMARARADCRDSHQNVATALVGACGAIYEHDGGAYIEGTAVRL